MFTELKTWFADKKDPVLCSLCGSDFCVWFPTPRTATTEELAKVKAVAKCEYCLFRVTNA